MDKETIYRRIVSIYDKKQKHIEEYTKNLENIIASGSPITFFTGHCDECEAFDKEISDLEKQYLLILVDDNK